MSSFVFVATCVAIEQPDGEFDLVGFADSEYDPKSYLMLQRAFQFDEQDVKLGMDTYHVEWCDQGSSGYGGISRVFLTLSTVEFEFNPKGIEFLGGLETLKISIQLKTSQLRVLHQALDRIFEGSGCLIVADT
jgi:Immunity protein 10